MPSAVSSQAPSARAIATASRLQRVLRERMPDGRRRATSWRGVREKVGAVEVARRRLRASSRASSGSSRGSRPRRRTPPISAMVRSRIGLLVADEGDAEQRDRAALQRLDRQQAVVDGAERGRARTGRPARASARRARSAGMRRVSGTISPPAPSTTSGRGACGQREALDVDLDAVALGGEMRRGRRAAGGRPRAGCARPAGPTAARTISLSVSPSSRLHRLPVGSRRAPPRAPRQTRSCRRRCRCR